MISEEKANTRIAFRDAMIELAAKNPKVVLVCADSILVVRGAPFKEKFPERFFDFGIAEQNAVACAAGMATCGLIPFMATYAGFITMRACEQLRTFVAYPGLNVKFVGANGGMASGEREGVTHQFFEDLGILRTIPGISVVVPSDPADVKEAVKAAAAYEGPVYIRIGSGRDPKVFTNPPPFHYGKIRILTDFGTDFSLFANGFVLPRALLATEILKKENLHGVVVEVHTLKPLDIEEIVKVLQRTRAAVTVEDHNIIGGLGSAIAEVSAESVQVPLKRVGLMDVYPESGESEELLDHLGIGIKDIVEAVKNVIKKKERWHA